MYLSKEVAVFRPHAIGYRSMVVAVRARGHSVGSKEEGVVDRSS